MQHVPLPTYKQALLQTVAYRNIQTEVNSVLQKYDLNTTQWIILGFVHDCPTVLRVTDIAELLQVEGPFITSLVRKLAHKSYVRLRAHPKDSRARLLELTNEGTQLVPEVEKELSAHLSKLIHGFPPEDLTKYFQILERLISNIEPLSIDVFNHE